MVRTITTDPERARRYREGGYWDGGTAFHHLEAAAARPDALAIVDRAGELSYGGLLDEVERASAGLAAHGVGIGDVVSWQLPNRREGTILHLAAVRMGAISNPIVPIYREREISFILAKAASKVLVVPGVFRDFDHAAMARALVADAAADTLVLSLQPDGRGPGWEDLVRAGAPVPPVEQRGDRLSLLQFTSGTTADAKGVLHSNDTMSWEARSYSGVYKVTDRDVALTISPISHMAGLLAGVFVPVLHGIPSVYLDRWDAGDAIRLIDTYRCSVASGAAPFLGGIVSSPERERHDIASFRFFGAGGSDVPPALIRAADAIGITAARSYGCTECPTISAGTADEPFEVRGFTDGVVQPGVTLQLLRQDGTPAAPGEAGEIVVDAPMRMVGYLDPRHEEGTLDADGRLFTGDLGVLDDGQLRITGRSKDISIRGGENISAKEVEDVLYELPAVVQAAVVGAPDDVLGERVVAFLAVRGDLDPAAVIDHVRASGLARQKIPEQVRVLDALPETASGKIQKFKLRALLRDDA